jgi:hypothetical protein
MRRIWQAKNLKNKREYNPQATANTFQNKLAFNKHIRLFSNQKYLGEKPDKYAL